MYTDTSSRADIVIVDDHPDNLRILSRMLLYENYTVRPAINGQTALIACEEKRPDMVLLDINMPDMSGYQVIEALKARPETADVPVIFISALNDLESKIRAFDAGGVDYISKPFQVQEVLARIRTHLTLDAQKREIARLHDQYKDLFDNAHDLIQSVDEKGNYIYVNQHWCDVLGYSREDSVNMNISDVIHPEYIAHCVDVFKTLNQQEAVITNMEIVFLSRDGDEVLVEGNVNSQRTVDNHFHTRGIFRDITHKRQAEQQRLEMKIERERMQLITEFFQRTSHDIRTPLTIIKQQPYFLRRIQDPEKVEGRLEIIEMQVNRITHILEDAYDLIHLQQVDSVEKIPIRISNLIQEVLQRSQAQLAEKSLQVVVEHDDDNVVLDGDYNMLLSAIQHIMNNAIAYTDKGGHITLSTGYAESHAAYFIKIADNGSGIDEESLKHIFEPTYKANLARTLNNTAGGMGLAITDRIMQLHGGKIEVNSILDQGSDFSLFFP